MRNDPRPLDWATPLLPLFGWGALATRLRLLGPAPCLRRRQGLCEDRTQCADCAWSEGPAPGR